MSDDTDPAHWVFPPRGAPNVPTEISGAFGPVRYGDTMILQWAPATQRMLPGFCYVPVNMTASCVLLDDPVMSPYTWKFTQRPPYNSTICHMFFRNTTMGNTVTWEYLTEASANPKTWAADAPSSTATAGSSTTTLLPSSSPTSGGLAASSTAPPPRRPTPSSALSAGIGVLATVAVLAIALFVFLWLRRRRSDHAGVERSPDYEVTEREQPPTELSSPVSELPIIRRKPMEMP